jgi:hypothetical protein
MGHTQPHFSGMGEHNGGNANLGVFCVIVFRSSSSLSVSCIYIHSAAHQLKVKKKPAFLCELDWLLIHSAPLVLFMCYRVRNHERRRTSVEPRTGVVHMLESKEGSVDVVRETSGQICRISISLCGI